MRESKLEKKKTEIVIETAKQDQTETALKNNTPTTIDAPGSISDQWSLKSLPTLHLTQPIFKDFTAYMLSRVKVSSSSPRLALLAGTGSSTPRKVGLRRRGGQNRRFKINTKFVVLVVCQSSFKDFRAKNKLLQELTWTPSKNKEYDKLYFLHSSVFHNREMNVYFQWS